MGGIEQELREKLKEKGSWIEGIMRTWNLLRLIIGYRFRDEIGAFARIGNLGGRWEGRWLAC
jgi:hypothetical protein